MGSRSRFPSLAIAAVVMTGLLWGCVSAVSAEPAKRLNFFLSSHSETDDPFGDYLAAVLKSKGYLANWNQQIIIGSPIEWRIFADKDRSTFAGYRQGKNRDGATGLDVVKELGQPDRYDVLLIAEGHNTVAVLRWHETERTVRSFHDRLVAGNPKGTTYLIEPWESFKEKSKPEPWMALERDATKIWGCVVERVNLGLAHEGREDRVASLPIAAALVHLVDRAALGTVPGLTRGSQDATMDALFKDDVHPTHLGLYYVALATFVGTTGQSAVGAWHPPAVSLEEAEALQKIVDEFFEQRKTSYEQPDLAGCRRLMADSFCERWNAYVPNKWVGPSHDCVQFFDRESYVTELFDKANPLYFDPAKEEGYWLPAP
jgi:hypothetical protein